MPDLGPPRAIGETCDVDAACETGICADGVCCAMACDGACEACDLAGSEGSCLPLADGSVCRASVGACDVEEVCDAGECPSDDVLDAGVECRASAGSCDVAEACDGLTGICPADARLDEGTECRAATGPCDVAEVCDGAGADCPAAALAPEGTICRASAGDCDPAELCDGLTDTCPADELASAGVECRAAAGSCDVAEVCDGVAAACPADVVVGSGIECRASLGICDPAEVCDGVGGLCPADALAPSETECRPSAGLCDEAESCTGSDPDCPTDSFVASGSVCRASLGVCDPAETCSGSAARCPDDARARAGTACRASAGTCDVVEVCDGAGTECPDDDLLPTSATVCEPYLCPGDGPDCTDPCADISDCVVGHACVSGACVPAKRVFATSMSYPGNLGGVVGADTLCGQVASGVGFTGTWRAWVSDNVSTPATRFNQHAGPYMLIDGTVIADNWADLIDGALAAGITLNEEGGVISPTSTDSLVWTATNTDGTHKPFGPHCQQFTSSSQFDRGWIGRAGETSAGWTDLTGSACHVPRRLYCFEQ